MPFLKDQLTSLVGLGFGPQGTILDSKEGAFFTEPFVIKNIGEYNEIKLEKVKPYNKFDFNPSIEERRNSIRKNRANNATNAAKIGGIVGAAIGTGIAAGAMLNNSGDNPAWITALVAVIGGATGAIAGGLLGVGGSQGVDAIKLALTTQKVEDSVNSVRNGFRNTTNAVIDTINEINQTDFLFRNGLNFIPSVADDLVRVGKWFMTPKGLLFIVKQQLLERQNVKIPSSGKGNRLYNPLGTLTQIGVNPIGGHIDKQGLNPFKLSYFIGGEQGYFKETLLDEQLSNTFTSAKDYENRLVQLALSKIFTTKIISTLSEKYDIDVNDPNSLIKYSGGSSLFAPLGIGKSRIRIWNKTVKKPSWDNNNDDGGVSKDNSVYVFSSDMIATQSSNYQLKSSKITDFRKTIADNKGTLPSTNYTEFNRENTYSTSKTTYKGNFVTNISNSSSRVIDPNIPISKDALTDFESDIIDLQFTILNSQDRSLDMFLPFRAYIENWSDNWKSDWNAIKYIGRANPFYKYSGFSRTMQLSFLIPALSRADMPLNYTKLNALLWAITPDYSGGLMKGTLVNFKFGDYIDDSIIINNIDINEIDGMGWDIDRSVEGINAGPYNVGGDGSVGKLPKGIKVNMSITPLNVKVIPRWGDSLIGVKYNEWNSIVDSDNNDQRISQIDGNWFSYDASDYNKQTPPVK